MVGNKNHQKGYLFKRKKKTLGWTSSTTRFLLSDPENGELCFFKSDIDWNAGEPPHARVPLAGTGVRASRSGWALLEKLSGHGVLTGRYSRRQAGVVARVVRSGGGVWALGGPATGERHARAA